MEFIDSTDGSMGIFWLCLGSTMLCLGSMFLNKYKKNKEIIESEKIEGPRKKLIIFIIIFLIAFLFILATLIISTLLS